MVKRFFKAGVYEDGSITISDEGTPQGGLSEVNAVTGQTFRVCPLFTSDNKVDQNILGDYETISLTYFGGRR